MKSILTLLLLFSAAFSHSQTKPFVLGLTDELYSRQLGEKRILNIYLPEGYDAKDTVHYPVIYLLDGGADEDFIHIAGLVQFNSFEWINRVPKSIVVGIANTDRKHDLSFPTSIAKDKETYPTTGSSARFMAFIETELQPYIERTYKTNSNRTLIGESLGGLFATEILLKKPKLFNYYILVSPSVWWDNGSILKLKSAATEQPTRVYIAVGKEGKTPGAIPHVMETDARLLYNKVRLMKNTKVYFDYLPNESHATIGHQAVLNAFKVIYKPH